MIGSLNALSYALGLSIFGIYAIVARRRRVPRAALWILAALAAIVASARCENLYRSAVAAGDYYAFHASGRAVLTGGDPYAPRSGPVDDQGVPGIANGNVPLNPPTALPLFALFGMLPLRAGYLTFVALNLALLLLMPWLSAKALALFETGRSAAAAEALPLLAATLVVSWSAFTCIVTGQISIVTAAAIVAALAARQADRHLLAGVCLALATLKPNTLLPFLLLFLRRSDLKTWIAFCLAVAALILIATPPSLLPGRLFEILGRIGEYGKPGRINDPSFSNDNSVSILGLDRVFYCLGLSRRSLVAGLQAIILGTVGLILARRVVFNPKADRAASIALIAGFAPLFFYHRQGDAVLLILPLTHAVVGFLGREASRAERLWLTVAIVAMLAALYMPGSVLKSVWDRLENTRSAASVAVRLLALPLANYGLIAAFVSLWIATAIRERRESRPVVAS